MHRTTMLAGATVMAVVVAACTPDSSKAVGSSSPAATTAVGPEAGLVAPELMLSLKGPPKVRSGAAIPLELQLVNRSRRAQYWLGGSATPPVVRFTAQCNDHGVWVDVPLTPVDTLCGPSPFSWTTPVNPIEPGGTWTFEDEFAVTTARCSGRPLKFIGFEFPQPGPARIVARYVYPGQTQRNPALGAPLLPPFELVSTPLEVEVMP